MNFSIQFTTNVQIYAVKQLDKLTSRRCIKGLERGQMQFQKVPELLDLIGLYSKKDHSVLVWFPRSFLKHLKAASTSGQRFTQVSILRQHEQLSCSTFSNQFTALC